MMFFLFWYSDSIKPIKKRILSKEFGRFYIPLGYVRVPGVFRFDVDVSASATASVNIPFYHHGPF